MLHQQFHGTLTVSAFNLALFGHPELCVFGEQVLLTTGFVMQLNAYFEQIVAGMFQCSDIATVDPTVESQHVKIRGSIAGKACPAQEVDIAETAGRTLDVGFQLHDRAAMLFPFLPACFDTLFEENPSAK